MFGGLDFSTIKTDLGIAFRAEFKFVFSISQCVACKEGFAFVIQRQGKNALGDSGQYLGYGSADSSKRILPSIAIEFDFKKSSEANDIDGTYVV